MKYNKTLISRIEFLIENAEQAKRQGKTNRYGTLEPDTAKMRSFRSSSLSFISDMFGQEHPYYYGFKNATKQYYVSNLNSGIEILNNIKKEIEEGWLISVKAIVSSEIFSDFLEMAEHLLKNDYKDPAAVMIGSVLEEHLRQLCQQNGIEVNYTKHSKEIPVKADSLNNELAKAGVYNKLEQKTVTANLDLRNKAAHGHYSEYDKNQVLILLDSVSNFILRNPI